MNIAPQKAPVLIVGAGPAGLAVAVSLKMRGIAATVIEQSDRIAPAWHEHYDRLHLHTDKKNSTLPGYPWPASVPRYPSKAQVLDYLTSYARKFEIPVRLNEKVLRAERDPYAPYWCIQTSKNIYQRQVLVVAGGHNRVPYHPVWPGQSEFQGEVIHSAQYRNGQPYKDKQVLVVGFGNSGGEIAMDLHEHGAKVTLAVRSPVNIIPKEVLGIPFLTIGILQQWLPAWLADAMNRPVANRLIGDLKALGLQSEVAGPVAQIRGQGRVPFIDTGTVELIRAGHVAVRPGIARLSANSVVFTDGCEQAFDAMVLATGYRTGLNEWLHLPDNVLSLEGKPAASGKALRDAPGLYFCGYHVAATGMLREIGLEAQKIAGSIQRSGLWV